MNRVRRDANEQLPRQRVQCRDDVLYLRQDVIHENSDVPGGCEGGFRELYVGLHAQFHLHFGIRANDGIGQTGEFCAIFSPQHGPKGSESQFEVADGEMQMIGQVFLIGSHKDGAELYDSMFVEPVDFMKKPERIVTSTIRLSALDECPLIVGEVANPMLFELALLDSDGEIRPTRVGPLRTSTKVIDCGIKGRSQMIGNLIDPCRPAKGGRALQPTEVERDTVVRWIENITVYLASDFIGVAFPKDSSATLESFQLCTCRTEFEVNAGRGFHGVYSHHERQRSANTEDPEGSGNLHPQRVMSSRLPIGVATR